MKKTNNIKAALSWLLAAILLSAVLILLVNPKHLIGSGQYAMGYFASGQFAMGIFAAGQFAIGVFSIGIFSIGIFSLGIFNIGIYAIGLYLLGKRYSKRVSGIDVFQSSRGWFVKSVLLIALPLVGYAAQAQIPNGDFESWTDHGTYLSPTGFACSNQWSQDGHYAVSRSSDHPMESKGQYSVRIESKNALLPAANGYGLLLQNPAQDFLQGSRPSFAIEGHPSVLRGQYRYLPQNGDTMAVLIQLFHRGQVVGFGQYYSVDSSLDWTAFEVQISPYVEADSGSIVLASYYALGGPPRYRPSGNSVLYIDDLSLNSSSVSIATTRLPVPKVYPNPTTRVLNVTLSPGTTSTGFVILDAKGCKVQQGDLITDQHAIDVSSLASGLYRLVLDSGSSVNFIRM